MANFLDEVVAERRKKNAAFDAMVEAALERRRLLRTLAEERAEQGLSQTTVAALMGTSQSSVARIESGDADMKLSTLERYASTLGKRIEWRIVSARSSKPADRKRARAS
jgi:transcriptional regulator with XRE-family HTH domain